jgi:tight adherence protein B
VTPQAWLAIAVAFVVTTGPAGPPNRVGVLAGLGRLAVDEAGDAGRTGPWPRLPPRARWAPALATATGAVLVGVAVAVGVVPATAAAAVAATVWRVAHDAALRHAAQRRRAELLAALRVLIGELEAGARPAAALGAAAEAGPTHAATFAAAAAAAESAADAGSLLTGHPETHALGLAWRLAEETGVELCGVLTRVAADLTAVEEQRRGVAIALAGPRASATLLTGLPLLGVGLGLAMGARPQAFLIGSSGGRVVGCVGVLLDVAGVLWMRRILRRAEQL